MMNGKEKIYFLLDAIDNVRAITSAGQPLIIDPTNDLNRNYRDIELAQLFTKLAKDEQVLKVLKAPSRTREIDIVENLDPYDYADDGCWHIELLPAFDDYYLKIKNEEEYQDFIGKKPPTQSKTKPERKALEKIWNVLQEIEVKREIGSENNPIRLACYLSYGQGADDLYEIRKTILEKLQSLEAITGLHKGEAGAYLYWSFNLGNNYQRVYEEYRDWYKEAAEGYQQAKQMEEIAIKDPVYEVKYSEKTREILINNFLLANPDFDSENERVFTYLYTHPNQRIDLKQLEKYSGRLTKTLHKIVENLGFTKNLKRVFFDVSKTGVRFRNPVTKKDLEELRIPYLKLQ